jgi:hypothetical protein
MNLDKLNLALFLFMNLYLSLQNSQFVRGNHWRQDGIAYKLASRANKEIQEIEVDGQIKKITF